MSERAASRPFIQYGKNYSDEIARARAANTYGAPTFQTAPGGPTPGMTRQQLIESAASAGGYGGGPAQSFSFPEYTEAEISAMELANSERVAGLDENEQRAIDMASSGAGTYEADLNRARELTERGASTFLDADIQAYMNPYIKGALDPAARELREQVGRDTSAARAAAARAGAFGGSRATLLETETTRGGQEAIGDLYARGYHSAFESGAQRFEADRQAAARGAEQFRALGSQRQAQLAQDINALLTTGGLRRQLQQAKLDFNFEQFQTARDWDVNNLKPLLAALATVPHSTQTTNEAKTSAMGNIIGLASVAIGAFFGGGGGVVGQGDGQIASTGTGGGGGTFDQAGQGPPEPGAETASTFRPGLVPIGQTFYGVPA